VSIDKGAQHNEEGGSAALFQTVRSHIGAAITVRAAFLRVLLLLRFNTMLLIVSDQYKPRRNI